MTHRHDPERGLPDREDDTNPQAPAVAFARDGRGGGPVELQRRRMLQVAGVVAAGAAVGGASWLAADPQPNSVRGAAQTIKDHRVRLPASVPQMVIVHGTSPSRNVQAGLKAMGGMQRFVSPGEVVLVKPNIGWDRTPLQAGNSNPEVVAELVRACVGAGAKRVVVTDCPVHDAVRTFKTSGIAVAARQAGAKVILPQDSRHVPVKLSQAFGTWDVLEPFVTADKIINVPVVKHHGSAGVTAGMKNWIGITLKGRGRFHGRLDATIAELAALMRPTLTVLDATRVLLRNGPQGGSLSDVKQVNAITMSGDPVAADCWAAEQLAAPVSSLAYVAMAAKLGLGRSDYRQLSPRRITVT